MSAAIIDAQALNRLGAVVHHIRPQWDAAGIRASLEKALAHHSYPDVALVAVSSARDPKAATPGVIPTRCANGWMANTNDDVKPTTPTPDTVGDMRCPRCPHWVVRGEPHTCAPLAEPDPDRLAAIKAAIASPPPERPVEDVDLPDTEETSHG